MSTLEFSQLLGNYGEFIGAIAIVVTLIYLAVQLRQNTAIAMINGTEDNGAMLFYWAELVAENPQVWVKGLSGEDLSAEESAVFWVLASASDFRHFTPWLRANSIGASDQLGRQFVRSQAFDIYTSPGLLSFWQKHQERLNHIGILDLPGEEWIAAVNEQIKQFQEASTTVENQPGADIFHR